MTAAKRERDDDGTADPVAVWSGELTMAGVRLHVHVLDNGERIIDAADFLAFWQAMESGTMPAPTDDEVAAFARWQRGEDL